MPPLNYPVRQNEPSETIEKQFLSKLAELEQRYGLEVRAAVEAHIRTISILPVKGKPRADSLLSILNKALSTSEGYRSEYSNPGVSSSTPFRYLATSFHTPASLDQIICTPLLLLPKGPNNFAEDLEHTLKEANNLLQVNRVLTDY